MNSVCEIGRLTSDVELKMTPSGKSVCSFTIAVYRTKEITDFLPCVAWRQTAERITRYFRKGNMKSARYGTFDAAICIFNAIGHLTRLDCSKFFKNAYKSLNDGGIFVFDILNFNALKDKAIFELYKDFEAEAEVDNWLVRRVRDCSLNKRFKQVQIKSYTAWNDSIHFDSLIEKWNMQIYEAKELLEMLDMAGFNKVELYDQNGCKFVENKSGSIMCVCYK